MKVTCTIIKHRKENKYTVLVLSMHVPIEDKGDGRTKMEGVSEKSNKENF
jgi:hypothetical protein